MPSGEQHHQRYRRVVDVGQPLGRTPSLQATIFTGGGSKDPQDISGTGNGENFWAWKDGAGGLPDKDNLLHSFAVRYSLDRTEPGPNGPGTCPNGTGDMDGDGNNPEVDDPNTPNVDESEVVFDPDLKCELLYFGLDRFDNSGDAQQGFWFLQDQIGLTTVKSGGGFKFSGVHTPGDLLVISEFSNGGDKSTIRVFVWDPTVSGNLRLLDESTAANCATSPEGDPFCGIVSPAGLTTSPWSFLDKSGNTNFANGELFEAGVNLSLLGLAGECFASVLSETRASTATTATLKDFVLGSFANCVPGLTTQVSATGAVAPGIPVTDLATILVTGGDNPPDPTGGVTFFLCGPGANGGTPNCDGTTGNVGTQIGTAVTLKQGLQPCEPERHGWFAVRTVAECERH